MRFGSVCSGIEAASVAWHPLGWKAAWLAEIEPFPSSLLRDRYQGVTNLGDMTKLPEMIQLGEIEAPDIFCGGTPCQAFSVAGLRRSLDDARGNLALVFCEIANAIDDVRAEWGEDPAIIFWENVPGVLNTKDNAFGCFLAGLAGEDDPLEPPGGRWTNAGYVLGPKRAVAWRVLDAQYFGVAQRRRRVFVVASARDGFDPAAVLFEFDSVRRDTPPSRETREEIAGAITASLGRRSGVPGCGSDAGLLQRVETICMAHGQGGAETSFDRTPTLTCNHEAPIVSFPARLSGTQVASTLNLAPTLAAHNPMGVAYSTKLHNTSSNNAGKIFEERTCCLDANSPPPVLLEARQVRRLTPRECERLQGFPDDHTLINVRGKPAADGPRYKAIGNSWAVPNVRWIGRRIWDEAYKI